MLGWIKLSKKLKLQKNVSFLDNPISIIELLYAFVGEMRALIFMNTETSITKPNPIHNIYPVGTYKCKIKKKCTHYTVSEI